MKKATWGDTVIVVDGGPSPDLVGALAEVVSITEIDNEEMARVWGLPVGERLILVEFGTGSTARVPEKFLRVSTDE